MGSSNDFIRMRTNSTCFSVDGNNLVTWEKLMMQEGDYQVGDGIGSRVQVQQLISGRRAKRSSGLTKVGL